MYWWIPNCSLVDPFRSHENGQKWQFFFWFVAQCRNTTFTKIAAKPEYCRFDVCVDRVKVQSHNLDVMFVFLEKCLIAMNDEDSRWELGDCHHWILIHQAKEPPDSKGHGKVGSG